MSEGIILPEVPRGVLLSVDARRDRLESAAPQILSAVSGESSAVAIEATLACLIYQALPQASWCGFYRRTGERTLTVGPYQGPMGCLRIDFDRGVCGACARTGERQLWGDVSLAPDHIACDDATRSELVLPILGQSRLEAVLDLDSHHLDGFSTHEADLIAQILRSAFDGPDLPW